MAGTALSALRTRMETLADIDTSFVLTTARENELINSAYRAVWSAVTLANKRFRMTAFTFTLTNSRVQAFPADFREAVDVIYNPGTPTERYLTNYGPKTGTLTWDRSYRVDASSIIIEPLQGFAGNYQLNYIPQCPVLTADSDTLDVEIDQFSDCVTYHAAIAAATLENSDVVGGLEKILYGVDGRSGFWGDLKKWAAGQRMAETPRVEDVRRRKYFDFGIP